MERACAGQCGGLFSSPHFEFADFSAKRLVLGEVCGGNLRRERIPSGESLGIGRTAGHVHVDLTTNGHGHGDLLSCGPLDRGLGE